jgi:hypothetical protein
MPRAAFEPTIPAIKRPQTYAFDSAATGIGILSLTVKFNCKHPIQSSPGLVTEAWRLLLTKVNKKLRIGVVPTSATLQI